MSSALVWQDLLTFVCIISLALVPGGIAQWRHGLQSRRADVGVGEQGRG
ncbi:hypothetical protein [Zooshikella ganghwensis]|nr:hypothetical protein [Zooshikella ganghwensis]